MKSDDMSPVDSNGALPISLHLEIEALMRAVRWPEADLAAVMTLTGLLIAARRFDQARDYFFERAKAEPQQPLYEALAGFFQAETGHDIDVALTTFDHAAGCGRRAWRGVGRYGAPAPVGRVGFLRVLAGPQ